MTNKFSIDFYKEAEKAAAALPEEIKKSLENIEIFVDDKVPAGKLKNLLGFYRGVSLKNRGISYGGVLPDQIVLVKKNLEAMSANDEELKRNIKDTVIHEVGHYLGLTEEEIKKGGFG